MLSHPLNAMTLMRQLAVNGLQLDIELVCAAQARDFHPEFQAGRAVQAVHEAFRRHVPRLEGDRYLHTDLEAATAFLRSGELVDVAERELGAPLDA